MTITLRCQGEYDKGYAAGRASRDAEIEALRADAERYRWLRNQELDDPEIFIGIDSPSFPNRWALGHEDAAKIDQAIDAARAAQEKQDD
jgi:hypothetical protein